MFYVSKNVRLHHPTVMCNGYGDFKIEYFQLSGQFGMIKSQKCMQYNHHSVVGREYNYN